MARSFVATQQNPATTLIIWIYEQDELALVQSVAWKAVEKHTNRVKYEIIADESVAFAALSKYGGLWFDINTLFVRDFSPLLWDNDWIAQATCSTGVYGNPFLGSSMMYFHKRSPHLCELKSAVAAVGITGADRDDRAGELYYRVYQRLLRNGRKPWAILPWCYVNPSQCSSPNRLQDPFAPSGSFDLRMIDSIFAYHYHSNPPSEPSGLIYTYLDNKYSNILNW
ncbi:hypothetical protein BX666DRAFT_1867833 [Dichotomocladium elegans]|nr:hypothetical protein BX666DRAFT_1867833 [Dichotomocladium elegans]